MNILLFSVYLKNIEQNSLEIPDCKYCLGFAVCVSLERSKMQYIACQCMGERKIEKKRLIFLIHVNWFT